jgi:type IV pilus assembly protein PilC
MKFKYKIQTKAGVIDEGVREAESRLQLAHELKNEGSIVFSVEEDSGGTGLKMNINIPFLNKVKLRDKIMFAKNLAGMLKAGLSMPKTLSVLANQTKNVNFKNIINDILKGVDRGEPLSRGLTKYEKTFSSLFVSMVKAGEESGRLPDALKEIANNLEKIYSLQKKVKGAMTYPAVIIGAIGLIGVLMMMYVVPTLTGTFKEMGVPLPFTTRMVVLISDFLAENTIVFFISATAIISAVVFLIRRKESQPFIDALLLKIPVIGTMIKETNSARVARTMTTLLTSGVTVTRALEITKDVVGSTKYQKSLDDAIANVQKGKNISQTFKENQNLYPSMVGEMIEVGEDTGDLSQMLLEVAEFYEAEVDSKTKNLSTIVEPVLMIFIGVAVGFFAISMLTPMYSLMDTIQ